MLLKLFIFVFTIIGIDSLLYFYFGLVQNNIIAIYFFKLLPALALAIQTLCAYVYYKNRFNEAGQGYCRILFLVYIFCLFGDYILIYGNINAFIGGMMTFALVYILLTISVASDISKYEPFKYGYPKTIVLPVAMNLVLTMSGLAAALYIIDDNIKFGEIFLFVGVVIYVLIMAFTSSIHLIHYIIKRGFPAFFSLAGIYLFMLSDFLIILHDMKYPILPLEFAIMLLYWSGIAIISWSVYQKEISYISIDS